MIKWKRRKEGNLFTYSIVTDRGRVEVEATTDEQALKLAAKKKEPVIKPTKGKGK